MNGTRNATSEAEFAGKIIGPKDVELGCCPRAATNCLLLGIVAMFIWVVPALGMTVPMLGLACWRRGRKSANWQRASYGFWLCIISILMGASVYYLYFVELRISAVSSVTRT